MSSKNSFNKINLNKKKTLEESFVNLTGQEETMKLLDIKKLIPNKNPYPISEIEDMIESIKQYGIEQNLVVKEMNNGNYLIVTGHRRYFAILNILKNDIDKEYDYLNQVYCKIISSEENEIITRLRLHETNFEVRPLHKMSEEEKMIVVNEYVDLIKSAREKGLLIKGKAVKGKTRNILANMLSISPTQAGREMAKAKKGVQMDTLSKSEEELLIEKKEKANISLIKILKKNVENDYLDKELIKEINQIVKEYNKLLENKRDPNQLSILDKVNNNDKD